MTHSKLKAKDVKGMTALDKASEARSLECLDRLLEYEWSWEDCKHPLSYAAKADQASAFSTLDHTREATILVLAGRQNK